MSERIVVEQEMPFVVLKGKDRQELAVRLAKMEHAFISAGSKIK